MSAPHLVRRRLIVMVKEPRLGMVKSRLGRQIGATAATRFYRAASATLIARLGSDPRWRLRLAVAPDLAPAYGGWPGRGERVPQGRGDIGERMLRLLRAASAERAVLIGSDIPAVRPAHIAEAFGALSRNDLVFGPAEDGGFWLIGLRRGRAPKSLFDDVRWSGPDALSDSLASAAGCSIGFAATLSDVDDADSYRREGQAGGCVTPLARGGGINPSRGSPAR